MATACSISSSPNKKMSASCGSSDRAIRCQKTGEENRHQFWNRSRAAGEIRQDDPTISLDDIQLPPAELATRTAIAATKKKELLSQSGETFELTLLLTQTEALSYAWHLAEVTGQNEPQPGRAGRWPASVKICRTFITKCSSCCCQNHRRRIPLDPTSLASARQWPEA